MALFPTEHVMITVVIWSGPDLEWLVLFDLIQNFGLYALSTLCVRITYLQTTLASFIRAPLLPKSG